MLRKLLETFHKNLHSTFEQILTSILKDHLIRKTDVEK